MSRLFDDVRAEGLACFAAVVGAAPLTMACWFNSDDAAIGQCLMSICKSTANDNVVALYAQGAVAGDPVRFQMTAGGVWDIADTLSGYTANTWHHACGVWAGVGDRSVFIDGGSKGTNAGTEAPSGLNITSIGYLSRLTVSGWMSGHIAEAAVWNVALSIVEVYFLGKGYSPLFVRPDKLIAYWPLIRGLNNRFTGYTLSAGGTVVSAHCPKVFYPAPPQKGPVPGPGNSASGTGFKPIVGAERLRGIRSHALY